MKPQPLNSDLSHGDTTPSRSPSSASEPRNPRRTGRSLLAGCMILAGLAWTTPNSTAAITAVQLKVQEEAGGPFQFGPSSSELMDDFLNRAVPFVRGRNHKVTLWGDCLNMCERVDLLDANQQVFASVRGDAIQRERSGNDDRDATSNKDRITFNIPGAIIPTGIFRIAVRQPLLLAWASTSIRARPIRRLMIDELRWAPSSMPRITTVNGRETAQLTNGVEVALRIHTTAPRGWIDEDQVRVGNADHPTPSLFGFPVTGVSVNPDDPRWLTVKFKPNAATVLSNPLSKLRILDASPSTGDWGDYVYHRIASSLPTSGLRTDLSRLVVIDPNPLARPGNPCPDGFENVVIGTPEPTAAMLAVAPAILAPTPGATGVGTRDPAGTGIYGIELQWRSLDDFISTDPALAGRAFPIADHYEVEVVPVTPPPGFVNLTTLASRRGDLDPCSVNWVGTPENGRAWFLSIAGKVVDNGDATIRFQLPNLRPGTTYSWTLRAVNEPGIGCTTEYSRPSCRSEDFVNPSPAPLQGPIVIGTFTTAP